MRSTGDRLINKFVVPIARELAIALKAIHDGGIIHRDVKGVTLQRSKTNFRETAIPIEEVWLQYADMRFHGSRKRYDS